jgi:hypothetical protein
MTWDSGSGMFKYDWTIPWSAGTTVAGTCYAIDDQSAGSNWGDKYPFFTVTPTPTTTTTTTTSTTTTTTTIPITIPHVENSTTQNTTFCNNVTITVQAWDPEGIDTVILYDTQKLAQYDFGIPTSPVEPGFINVTIYTLYSPSQGYGWTTSPIDGRDRGFGTSLTRDLIFDSVDREFKVDIPNGTYDVTVYLGDMSYAHDNMDVTAEGTFLADNENTFAGEVKSFSSEVIVSDGQLNVIFHDDGGVNPHWTSNGLIIKQASSYVMEHVSGNNYTVSFHPNPGKHDVRFIVNDTLGYVNDTVTGFYYVYSFPSITSVDVTPDYPKTNDDLSCIPIGWYDPDGDLPQYYYQWYDYNSIITGATSSTYNCSISGCDKGDTITCVVIPYDTYQNGTAVNGSEIIENTGPTLTNISIDKTCVKLNTIVNVTTINAFDSDFDSIILRVSSSPKLYDLCNSSSAQPEIFCTFNAPWNDTSVHNVYGLVDDGLETSDEKSTTIQTDNSGPNAPTGLNPINGFKTNNNTPTFSWLVTTDVGCNGIVNKYQVSVYMDSSCSIQNRTKQLSTTNYTFPDPFSDGTYYWRVKARDGLSNWGNWSDCIQLIIDTKLPVVENSTTENVTEGQDEHETVDVWDENGVSSVYVETFEEYLKFDFQIPYSPVELGFINITKDMIYNSSVGYGWTSSPSGDRDRGIGSALERDLIFDSINRTFNIDLSNGDYFVTVFLGDMSYAHDDVDVYAEGILKLDDVNTSAGEIKRLSFLVPVSDGQLNVLFNDSGGSDPNWVCVGLIVSSMNQTYLMNYVSGNKYTVTIPSPSIGINHKRYVATDNAGNVNNLVIDWFYVNAKPSIVGVNITPNNPKTNDILNCTPYGWYDSDEDPEGYYYQWYDDGLLIVNATNSTYNCSSTGCDKGNVIYCGVTPYDSHQNGSAVNGSVIIGNSPPSKPKLSPETGTFHDVVYINCSGSTDPDGDSITYNIQTDVNGTWKDIVVNDLDGYYEWDISSYPCKNGVDLRCNASDGVNYSSWENPPSKKINIDNCEPIITYVNPTPNDGNRNINNWVYVNVTVNDTQSNISSCKLELNGFNESMNISGSGKFVSCYTNKTTEDCQNYTYKVYANDILGNEGNNSYRTNKENKKPTVPVLLSPPNATFKNYTITIFDWNNSTDEENDSITYDLLIDNDSDFSSPSIDKTNLTDSNYTLNGTEATSFTNGTYYWRVRAFDGYEYSNYSLYWMFAIDTNPPYVTSLELSRTSPIKMPGDVIFNITFNENMNTLIQPLVKFSPSPIIIDDGDTGYNETGSWNSASLPAYNNDVRWTTGDGSGDTAVWTPNITTPGKYKVYVSWTCHQDFQTSNAKYTVYYNGGNQTFSVDQRKLVNGTNCTTNYFSGWYLLGTFNFTNGASGYVKLNDTTSDGKNVVADAVKFESIIEYTITGNWTDSNTWKGSYYIDDAYNGNHTIRVSGAKDLAGNLMIPNDTYRFFVDATMPKVTSVVISPSNTVGSTTYVKAGNITFNLTFNMNMNATPLNVTYGMYTPYDQYRVFGDWVDPMHWSGYSLIDPSISNGMYKLRVSGGFGDCGNPMAPSTPKNFFIDTIPPIVRDPNAPDIYIIQNQTIMVGAKDPGAPTTGSGLDTVLVEINGSVNMTMNFSYFYYSTPDHLKTGMYYVIIPNTSLTSNSTHDVRFFVSDLAGNTNSNVTDSFYVNGTIKSIGGNIAFLCRDDPVNYSGIWTCDYCIENKTIRWLREQGWNVTVNKYDAWDLTGLLANDMIVCSEEYSACNPSLSSPAYIAHRDYLKPFVEITDFEIAKAAKRFGYIGDYYGSTAPPSTDIFITQADSITAGYTKFTKIFNDSKQVTVFSDSNLRSMVIDLADSGGNYFESNLFKVNETENHGRYAFVGWFFSCCIDKSEECKSLTPLDLVKDGEILLKRTLNWAQCGNVIGCSL